MTQNWIRDVYLIAYARDEFGGYTYRIPSKTVDVEKTEPIHFDFNLVLNKKTTTNFCQIKIYNLEENTRALLYTDTAQAIELYAGYKDDAGLLFRGNVINIQHYHLKTDWITEIYVADGFKELNQTPYIKNWKSGTSIQKIKNILGKGIHNVIMFHLVEVLKSLVVLV